MTHDHQHQRAAHADPDNPTALLRSLSSRSRVEGDGVWLEALADRETWNRQPPEAQDAAAQVVASRLGSEWEYLGMRVWECECRKEQASDYWPDFPPDANTTISHRLGLFVHRPTGMEFSLIPGGRCCLPEGCPSYHGDGWEGGLSEASRKHCFWKHGIAPLLVGRWPVTNEQAWMTHMRHGAGEGPSMYEDPELGPLPSTGASHAQVVEYLADVGLRLPSSTEWEHACRAGSTTRFYFGDDFEPEGHKHCWHAGNSNNHGTEPHGNPDHQVDDCCRPRPHAPSEHDAAGRHNAFGLVDMVGNVWEWTSEHGIAGGSHRYMPPDSYGLILRSGQFIHDEIGDVGFRAVCSIPGLEARS